MTEHPRNLAAWLDDELGVDESVAVTRHVEACGQCQARARSYAQVSGMLVEVVSERRTAKRWRAAVAWAGAIAAAVILCVAFWPKAQEPTVVRINIAIPPPVPAPPVDARKNWDRPLRPLSASLKKEQRRLGTEKSVPIFRPAPEPPITFDDGPVVRVAIPAEALFAPGAVPAGAQIYADLVLAADGSARELRLLP